MIECSLTQACEDERNSIGAILSFLSLPGRFPSLHWDSLPLTLLQGLSHWWLKTSL